MIEHTVIVIRELLERRLEDISFKKEHFLDIFRRETRKAVKELLTKEASKLRINHRLVDNRKTTVVVDDPSLLPGTRILLNVDISIYSRDGKSLTDTPINVQFSHNKGNWSIYAHTLFIRNDLQKQGLGKAVMNALRILIRKVSLVRDVLISAESTGRYAFSRIPGCRFETPSYARKVNTGYKQWCKTTKVACEVTSKPSDYPKNYLLSNYAPAYINYLVPVRNLK